VKRRPQRGRYGTRGPGRANVHQSSGSSPASRWYAGPSQCGSNREMLDPRVSPTYTWSDGRSGSSVAGMQALRDPDSITPRQREVIRLIAEGLSNEELGLELGISPRTAKAHCDVLRQKLGVPRRRQIPLAYRLLTGDDPLAKSLELARADDGG